MVILRCCCLGHLLVAMYLLCWANTACSEESDPEFVGPKPCPSDPETIGYDNTTTLTRDMLAMSLEIESGEANYQEEYIFTLCPSTIFNLGMNMENENDDQTVLPIIPFFDNSVFRCGNYGDLDNKCILRGGRYHVIIDDDFWWLNNVQFRGITFEESRYISVLAFGHPTTDVQFYNCEWQDNVEAAYLVAIFWNENVKAGFEPATPGGRKMKIFDKSSLWKSLPKQPEPRAEHFLPMSSRQRQLQGEHAMYAGFKDCRFLNNAVEKIGVLNQGGQLELSGCNFEFNSAIVVVANIQDAAFAVHSGTYFYHNKDTYGPVFLDSSSELKYQENTSGEQNNGGMSCQGIFMETPGYNCLFESKCDGQCCDFAFGTCAREEVVVPRSFQSPRGGCGAACKAFAVIIPVTFFVIFAAAVHRWRTGIQDAETDSEPAEPRNGLYML